MARTLAEQLCAGNTVVGPMMGADYPSCVTETVAGLGYNFIWLDLEHGQWDLVPAIEHVRIASRCDMAAIIRVPSVGDVRIAPLLDAGAQAVVFARTETLDEARQQVAATKYPPLGGRGVTSRKGFTNYAQKDFSEIIRDGNRDILTLPQIESVTAVEHIDELLATEGIDGVMMGQNDLAVDMGHIDRGASHPDVVAASQKVCDACQRAGKWFSVYGRDEQSLGPWKESGVQILVSSSILSFINRAGGDMLRAIKGATS